MLGWVRFQVGVFQGLVARCISFQSLDWTMYKSSCPSLKLANESPPIDIMPLRSKDVAPYICTSHRWNNSRGPCCPEWNPRIETRCSTALCAAQQSLVAQSSKYVRSSKVHSRHRWCRMKARVHVQKSKLCFTVHVAIRVAVLL